MDEQQVKLLKEHLKSLRSILNSEEIDTFLSEKHRPDDSMHSMLATGQFLAVAKQVCFVVDLLHGSVCPIINGL